MDRDWNTVSWDKRGERPSGVSKTAALNQAARKGQLTQEKKYGVGGNVQIGTTKNMTTLEDSEELKTEKISTEFKKLLMQERQKAGLNQKDLATACNLKINIIQDYEAGKGVPNGMVISKIEAALRSKNPEYVQGTLSKAQKSALASEKAKAAATAKANAASAATGPRATGPQAKSRRF